MHNHLSWFWQVNIHTDTLNESGFVEHTIAAFKKRTIHAYHRFRHFNFPVTHSSAICFQYPLCSNRHFDY